MHVDKNIIHGKWNEIKGEVRKAWGRLTDDEIEQTKGDMTAIKGLIEQRYGKQKEDYQAKLDQIVARFRDKKEESVESIKNGLKSH